VTTLPTALPETVEELRALVLELAAERSAYRDEISQLREYIRLLKRQHFGPKSERTQATHQPGLFNEAEQLVDSAEAKADGELTIQAHTRRKRGGGRRPLPDFLPREEILHDLAESERACPNDASHRVLEIGRDRLEQLVFVPATAKVIVHVRPKYACSSCKDFVRTAELPPQPIPKSMATPSLLAQIAVSKYVDGLPLYRQERIFERIGVDLDRGLLAEWMMRMGELVAPLVEQLLARIRSYDVVQADETRFQVLKEAGKRATSESYLWALRGGEPLRPILYYEYAPSRGGEVADRLLQGFRGFLQCDGYPGYNGLEKRAGILRVGCFAHARRKFDEALTGLAAKRKQSPKSSIAWQGLDWINRLYRIEREAGVRTADERYRLRQEITQPVLDDLRLWLDQSLGSAPPSGLTGKALRYLDGEWPRLMRVLDDGRLPLDTNAVENAIRPFVVGRRNWLFADTPRGATASARIYSLIETAKANAVDPWLYLERVFAALPVAKTPAAIEALLPWNVGLAGTYRRPEPRPRGSSAHQPTHA
jgi:transposase